MAVTRLVPSSFNKAVSPVNTIFVPGAFPLSHFASMRPSFHRARMRSWFIEECAKGWQKWNHGTTLKTGNIIEGAPMRWQKWQHVTTLKAFIAGKSPNT